MEISAKPLHVAVYVCGLGYAIDVDHLQFDTSVLLVYSLRLFVFIFFGLIQIMLTFGPTVCLTCRVVGPTCTQLLCEAGGWMQCFTCQVIRRWRLHVVRLVCIYTRCIFIASVLCIVLTSGVTITYSAPSKVYFATTTAPLMWVSDIVFCFALQAVFKVFKQQYGWIKMPLGTELNLGPGHIVLDGEPAPPRKGHSSLPLFGPCLLWPWSAISATAELLLEILLRNRHGDFPIDEDKAWHGKASTILLDRHRRKCFEKRKRNV